MLFSFRKPVVDPLALSRQVRRMDEIRERAKRRVKVLRQSRWYHVAAVLGLLLAPLVQYVGYLSTIDPRWFYYPLAVAVLVWVAVNVIAPTAVHVRLPLTWAKSAFITTTALLLIALASLPRHGLVAAYCALACDLIVVVTATTIVNLFNFARFRHD